MMNDEVNNQDSEPAASQAPAEHKDAAAPAAAPPSAAAPASPAPPAPKKAQGAKQAKGDKKGKGDKAPKQAEAEPEEVGPPPPPPRLREYYHRTVSPKLMKQFGFTNPHQVPRLAKIVLNVGVGEAPKTPKLMDTVVDELGAITGQRPPGLGL